MSIQQIVSPTRYIGRGKPRRTRKDIEIYCCSECGTYLTGWTQNNTAPQHCSNAMRKVEPIPNDQLDPALQIDYKIKGSLNNNCIIVTWGRVRPEWILMESFRGSHLPSRCRHITASRSPTGITHRPCISSRDISGRAPITISILRRLSGRRGRWSS